MLYVRNVKTWNHLGVITHNVNSIYIIRNGENDSVFKQISPWTAFQHKVSLITEAPLYLVNRKDKM